MKEKLQSFFAIYLATSCTTVSGAKTEFESLLDMPLEELMNIEIRTASKTSLTAGEIPASVIIINRKDIQLYGYSSLEEILNNVPGMYMTEDWAWFGSVNYGVRGVYKKSHFDTMAILVNGVSQMEDGKRGYPIEKINVPVQAIDRIEVIRGPMAVIHGSSAFLGAINIITNINNYVDDRTVISMSQGSHNTSKKFARLSGKEGDISFVFNAQNHATDGPSHPYSELMSDTSSLPVDWNLNTDAETVMTNGSQYFDFSVQYNNLNINFSHVDAELNVIDSQPGVGSGSTGFTKATNVSFDYTKQFNDSWLLTAKASFYYNNYFLDEEYNFTGFFSNNQSTTEAQEYELNALWTPSDSTQALFGLMRRSGLYKAYDDYPTFSLPNREIQVDESDGLKTNAVFTQINYKPANNLTIVGGLRAEWQEDYRMFIYDNNIDINNQNVLSRVFEYGDVSYIPQIAGIYDINNNQHIKLMYSIGENAPSPVNNLSILDLSQPTLEPEKTRSLEASYIIAKYEYFMQVGVFYNNVNDLIISSGAIENGSFVSTLSNIGKIETLGFELTTTAQINKSVKINFDISLHDVKDKTPGYENIEPAYAPTAISNLRASYSFSKNTHLSLIGHYTGSVLSEWKIANTGLTLQERIANGARTGDKIDSYSSFDANLLMQDLYMENLNLSIKVGNLTDESIRYPTINNEVFDKGTLGLGRNFLLTLEYSF